MGAVHPYLKSAAWMFGALASFLLMAIAGRELSDTMHTFQIVWIRSIVGTLIICLLVMHFGWHNIRSQNLKLHFFRNIVHFAAQFGWFLAVSLLPLATVFAIEFTAPIWIAIMAVIFLGEQMNRGRFVAIILGFAGILIIVRPGMEILDIGSIAVLGAAIGFGAALTITKYLTRTDSPLSILFYMMVIQLVIGAGPGIWFWQNPAIGDTIWILLVAITGLTSHYCISKAFQLADATVVMPLDFLRLPFAIVVGFLLYQEAIDLAVILGAGIIFAGNYYNIRRETRPQ